MKKTFVLIYILLNLAFAANSQGLKTNPQTFIAGNKEFLLNGKPYVVRAGELHFPRIPREYWDQRIKLTKAMGMNTICIYLFWNFHEQEQDVFDFTGQKDVAAFVKLVQENGMYCIVRPGPYACAEWDMGGLPWWLLKKQDIEVRTAKDAFFMQRTAKYLQKVGEQLAPLQIQNGGNIIMVQVENEFASFGNEQPYMEAVKNEVIKAGFDKVQLFRCDWSSNFNKYELDGVATTLNFGAGSDIDKQFKIFQEKYPTSPLMCSEYWSGWFDHWGRPHETRSISSFIGSLKDMLDRKISFSLYMAHGGTSFGQWGGANAPPYSAMATSYDYNAPIGEQGNTTDKFFAVRDLLKNYLQEGESLGEIPSAMPVIEIPTFYLNQTANLFDNLPKGIKSENIQPMEMFNQGWGRILYRTTLKPSAIKQKLVITEVHDWANVFINGKSIGRLDRRRGDNSIEIPASAKALQLDILVEATGRVNYGKAIIDRKGITQKVELINGKEKVALKNWTVYNFPVDYGFQTKAKFKKRENNGPAWFKGEFNLEKTGDTFLDVSTWGKGMVWVNGYNMGRFWKIGPQQTLFMPGVWLKKGKNEIIVLDVDNPKETKITGLKEAILNELNQDESLLHRTKNQNLDLSAEKPIETGAFAAGNGWKEVKFEGVQQGRYLCFEALNSQQEKDVLSAIAELELIGKDGNSISTLKWKVVYADSEEITAANNAADKVYDQQESTFWQSQAVGGKPKHPHQIVIDLGEVTAVSGLKYLPRSDKSQNGMVKDYRIFIKTEPFKM
ncbi:beta-galactosidase [Pedobacter cryophilus]|uniref:Beta-galactosidase n=1 Tax=Pedobacter cryophilus TaxID=2571271 RepID=A0A4U1BXW3_9SPHI|nr:beta-galactosidase [Pedobacter cryophilus]TKB96229.1 beta-galactosidase [Pedobacter cryophilus]